ncbi:MULTISPECIES: zf-HC2 domain-containing protein [Halomonas]|uniref:zf-HC2 domain-containing protein n=1 Tax=Halomonas TaxID=2745 RepID=UPI001C937E65|nr:MULTISPECIES: zf-HC2 domain-containing protein [Halomonas]MBY6207694.1 zf-HC2 domain-containing protein [Halomonas sp. DP3Y7-2]MBY6228503.1 zf-HC2 domain-containing protein [Halomonas sp. DP3Y7-1]MCA0916569.1 zf-HC2 domain-containing protein [Halomonas denitrificans]
MMMCKAATKLMSKQLDAPLTTREKFSLRFHLMLCSVCRRCDKQFEMLRKAGRAYGGASADKAEHHCMASEEDMKKVQEAIAQAEERRQG